MTLINVGHYLILGAITVLGLVALYFRSKYITSAANSIQNTTKTEDLSLQQQQLANQAKLAQINKELQNLYDEHAQLTTPTNETNDEKAQSWNSSQKPPSQ